MNPRLSAATLNRLPSSVARPGYDRGALETGVVHLGVGAFHRAHQAVVFDDLARAGDLRWGVLGVSLRSPAVHDQLTAQDGLYTVSIRDGDGVSDRVIGAVRGVRVAPEDPAGVIEALAQPDTRLVTLTVTEKGYRLDPASGRLLVDEPDVAADLAGHAPPRTAPGLICAGLALRRARDLGAFTAASCDNLPHNGARLQAAVLAMARARDPALADWIEAQAAFPQSMVDRIVPATETADLDAFEARAGLRDEGLVRTEPFSQWVIEDRFAGERPPLERVGVQVVGDVAPWETAKLRLLNGAHSAIAYLGGLAGIAFVHEFVALPAGRALVERLWRESAATLAPTPGLDLAAYQTALMRRFANPSLQHRTRQIAMDGSQKLPQRLLAPIAERLARGEPIDALALAVAAWIKWLGGRDDAGHPTPLDDPMAPALRGAASGGGRAAGRVAAVLALEAVFPSALAADPRLATALTAQLERLDRHGALAALP